MKGPTPFLIVLALIVFIIAGNNFVRYYLDKAFPVQVDISCDPALHSCFAMDPELADPAFQTEPYAKVKVDSANVPQCLEEHTCGDFTCSGVAGCTVAYCSSDSLEDGESCTAQNP